MPPSQAFFDDQVSTIKFSFHNEYQASVSAGKLRWARKTTPLGTIDARTQTALRTSAIKGPPGTQVIIPFQELEFPSARIEYQAENENDATRLSVFRNNFTLFKTSDTLRVGDHVEIAIDVLGYSPVHFEGVINITIDTNGLLKDGYRIVSDQYSTTNSLGQYTLYIIGEIAKFIERPTFSVVLGVNFARAPVASDYFVSAVGLAITAGRARLGI